MQKSGQKSSLRARSPSICPDTQSRYPDVHKWLSKAREVGVEAAAELIINKDIKKEMHRQTAKLVPHAEHYKESADAATNTKEALLERSPA